MAKDFEWDWDGLDTTPTIPAVTIIRVRLTDTAKAYQAAKDQGMIEANVLIKALDLLRQAMALLPGA